MSTEKSCPNCGKALPPDAPLGLCPECLIKSGSPTVMVEPPAAGFVPPTVEEIAKLFPQFEILSFIGKGGMGAVYRGRQPALDRYIALKVLPASVANDPGFAERFNREARALARLNHPNIVTVYDFGEVAQPSGLSEAGRMPAPLHYLLMEFVDGTNLREIERTGKLSPEQALAIVPQICDALQFAHNEGIVHRDIKPENLLLDKKGRLKITDFGIAKILGLSPDKTSLTGAKDVMGTPHYMAPEQIEKPQTVDHRADIYSLGVVFYEMLTGELPLGKFSPPSKKVQVDVRLDEVVLHTLEKEPERRYQQASQIKTDVQNITTTPPAIGFSGPAISLPPAAAVPPGPEMSDKIILPAFLLAFFFGVFGAHRFYVGKIRTGLLQLGALLAWIPTILAIVLVGRRSSHPADFEPALGLLLGFLATGCVVWAVVDWILLLCKVFTDGQGRRINHWIHPDARAPRPEFKPPVGAPPTPPSMGAKAPGPGPGTPPMTPMPGHAPPAAPNAMIAAPGIALMVAGALKLFGVLKNLWLLHWGADWLSSAIPGLSGLSLFHWNALSVFDSAYRTVAGFLLLFGGYLMFRKQSYAWAITAGIVSIVACSLISLPIGIWALIVLARDDVKAVFESSKPGAPASPGSGRLWSWSLPLVIIACIILFFAALASIGFAAVRTIENHFRATASSAGSMSGPELQKAGIYPKDNEFRKDFSQSFPLDTNGQFSINDIDGPIEIHGWNSNIVVLNAIIHGKSAESVAAVKINVDSDPSLVAVHTTVGPQVTDVSSFADWLKNDNGHASVDYTVYLPLGARLEDVRNIDGAVDIDGMTGDITASTVDGAARVKNAAGNLKLSTVDGSITADMDKLGQGQTVALKTVDGRIRLTLPDNTDANFSIATIDGDISSDFPELAAKKALPASSHLSGSLGNGGARVTADTVDGAVEILKVH